MFCYTLKVQIILLGRVCEACSQEVPIAQVCTTETSHIIASFNIYSLYKFSAHWFIGYIFSEFIKSIIT